MRTALLIAALLAVPATADATKAKNGKFLNGKFLNGKFLNTAHLDSTAIGSDPAFAPEKPGYYVWGVHVSGNGLGGWWFDWSTWSWQWAEDTFWTGLELPGKNANADGSGAVAKRLRIDSIVPAEPGSDVLLHYVSVLENNAWVPLCADETGRKWPALVLRGEWSEEVGIAYGGGQIDDSAYRVTFACATGALGKCAAECYAGDGACPEIPVDLGYRRWQPAEWVYMGWSWETGPQFAWRDYALDHQACTRMVRADYCGDGRSWTADGTEIDVYDRTHVNRMSETPMTATWDYEATWTEDGVHQLSCRRDGGTVNCSLPHELYDPNKTIPVMCYPNHGMYDPARLGNLRRKWVPIVITPL